ncbi:hypothetical protein C0995_013006, partial [Termitomyces sp. Mi166
KHIKLVQVAKAFLKRQSKLSQFFVLEGYKGKRKAKALLDESEQTGAQQAFKSMELMDSNSDEEEEEDRVHVIKKIKHEHIEELTGTRKRKEIIELEDEEVEIVAPKTPIAGPSQLISKPMVLIPSTPKPIPKLIITLPSLIAGPSTVSIVPDPASKPAATTPSSSPAPVKSTASAIKRVDTKESGVLIINQATEVSATQEILQDEESNNEDKDEDGNDDENGKGDDDDSNDDDTTMHIDNAKHPEETWPTVPTKTTVTKAKALMPVGLSHLI